MITKEQFDSLKVGDVVLYADKDDLENYGTPGTVTARLSDGHILISFPKYSQTVEFTGKTSFKWLDLPNE